MVDAVVITGQREFTDARLIFSVLNYLRPQVVIEGCARGADTLAGEWAKAVNREAVEAGCNPVVKLVEMPAPWDTHGVKAGPIRNRWMLMEGQRLADLGFVVALLAFLDEPKYSKSGYSKGTRNCIDQCLGNSRYEKDVFDLPLIDAVDIATRRLGFAPTPGWKPILPPF